MGEKTFFPRVAMYEKEKKTKKKHISGHGYVTEECAHVFFMQVSPCSALRAPDGGMAVWVYWMPEHSLLQLCQAGNSQAAAAAA